MKTPETHYAKTVDDIHIAYQVFGEGPVDLVFSFGEVSNVDAMWDPRHRLQAGFESPILTKPIAAALRDLSWVAPARNGITSHGADIWLTADGCRPCAQADPTAQELISGAKERSDS